MAQFAGAPLDGDGNPVECAVVSTAFELKGRSFADFDSFHNFRPHGVAGVVASKAGPASPRYFNANVIPDASLTESSRDGGIAWTGVPAGRHTLSASSPTHRFASFVADCRPGRFINASPPWGLHELANNETTNEAALAAPSVSLSVPASTRFGAAATATIAVTGPDGSRDGVVTVKDGARTVGSADVVAGSATIPLAALSVGEHQLTARYVPRGRSHWTTAAPARISVQRATTSTTLAAPSRADRKRMVSLRVRVRATGTEPRGTVRIYDGTKRLRTMSVKAGTFVIKVRLKKTGKRSLRAVFSGDQVAEGSQSAVQRVRVR
nr:Ig-like domain-containing protein [Aeromicrobium wangtongii]